MISFTFLPFVFHLSPTLGPVGRMISFTCLPFVFHLSPTWLPLWVVLFAFSFTCLPWFFHLFPLVSHSGSGWSHDFLHCSPICLSFPKQVYLYGVLTPFKGFVSLGRMILPLSPGLHPTLGALGRMSLHLSSTCLSHLSATLGALGRMSLQFTLVSHTRLPHLSFTLVSHSGCLGPHEFTLVFHLSPTLVSHSGCLGPHEFTLVYAAQGTQSARQV